jgi:hypothetical protein
MNSGIRIVTVIFFFVLSLGLCSAKFTLVQRACFAPPADADEAWFGRCVAIDQDTAVIGSTGHDFGHQDVEPSPATARVYRNRNGQWGLEAKLTPPDALSSTATPVSIYRDDLILGAEESNQVVVYHREGSDWIERARLSPPDFQHGDLFGYSLCIQGDWIGVSSLNLWDQWIGGFYLFHREQDAWILRGIIRAGADGCPTKSIEPTFSMTDTFLPGRVWIIVKGEQSGLESEEGVFMFSCGSDSQDTIRYEGELACPYSEDGFHWYWGMSLAIDQGHVMIGSGATGWVYSFHGQESDSWGYSGRLSSEDSAPTYHFGSSLAIDGEWAVIGGQRTPSGEPGGPAVYQQRTPGWSTRWIRRGVVAVQDRSQPYGFGAAVAISGRFILVSSSNNDTDPSGEWYRGEVYLFEIMDCPSADLNGDCTVNLMDLSLVSEQWLK